MPISIWRVTPEEQENESIAWLCDNCWRLIDQGDALSAWIAGNAARLPPGDYIADIGFAPREDAAGGGLAIHPATLRAMAELNMSIYLSEYPPFGDAPPAA